MEEFDPAPFMEKLSLYGLPWQERFFEAEVEAIVQLAKIELRLTRLGDEIQRTSRRLNALDHFVIPRLKAERDFIQMSLDEREHADHFRLMMVKHTLERKRETGG